MKANTIISEFLKRPVAYQPILAKAFGSVNLGIMWSQLYYWSDKTDDKDGWIEKNSKDILEETGLTRREQATARQIGIKLGVLEEKISGCPPTLSFRVDMEKAQQVVAAYLDKGQMKLIPEIKQIKATASMEWLRNMPYDDVTLMSEHYHVSPKFIYARAEDVIDYCEAKGKTYKNYQAALRNFIKSEIRRDPAEVSAYFADIRKREQNDRIKNAIDEESMTPGEIKTALDKIKSEKSKLIIKSMA